MGELKTAGMRFWRLLFFMKILHINCNYIYTTLHQLMIEELDKYTENTVFVPVYNGAKMAIKPNENVIVSNCFNKWDRLLFDYKQRKIIKAVEKAVDVSSYDLIHAYTVFTDGNCARYLSKKYGIPYVVAVRNTDVNVFFSKMAYLRNRGQKILRDAKRINFLSKSYQEQVISKYISKAIKDKIEDKIEIIPNGIDQFWLDNIYNNHSRSHNKIQLVCACGIDKNKNISAIQKAMVLLKSEGFDISLTVAGKIIDKKEYERLKKDDRTFFVGQKTKEELINIYRASDLFVMPSHHESFGLVYAEAMSQGLPIIYTKGQGFDGHFADGTVGYAVSDVDEYDIAGKIERIIDNFSEMNKNCIELVDRFSWKRIVEKYIKIYESVIDSIE